MLLLNRLRGEVKIWRDRSPGERGDANILSTQKRSNMDPVRVRKPGRPPTYLFDKAEGELTENEKRLRKSVMKRRARQNRSYHRRKKARELAEESARFAAERGGAPGAAAVQDLISADSFNIVGRGDAVSEIGGRALGTVKEKSGLDAFGVARLQDSALGALSAFGEQHGQGALDVFYCNSNNEEQTNAGRRQDGSGGQLDASSGMAAIMAAASGSGNTFVPGEEDSVIAEILNISAAAGLQKSAEMVRMAGVKTHLASGATSRLSALSSQAAAGLQDLIVFPGSFDAPAASAVMNLNSASSVMAVLRPLVELNFAQVSADGRYTINDITKSFFSNLRMEDNAGTHERFVEHFKLRLKGLDNASVNREGAKRAMSMKAYSMERANFVFARHIGAAMGGKNLMHFIRAGPGVIRYCESASDRVHFLQEALSSFENQHRGQGDCAESRAIARCELALGEAYFDMLVTDKAEVHLSRAASLMGDNMTGGCLDLESSVLVLLLLAQLRIQDSRPDGAKQLLIRALRALNVAGLQGTTFAVCCLTSLIAVYVMTNDLEKALATGKSLIDVLVRLGFSNMPLHADALGTLGAVNLSLGRVEAAEKLFHAGLEVVDAWINNKEWDTAPYHHCVDLDVSLFEYMAECAMRQGRRGDEQALLARAQERRHGRGLRSLPRQRGMNGMVYPRHIY